MYHSVVIDPESLKPELCHSSDYRNQAIILFKNLLDSGFIVIDKEHKLKDSLYNAVKLIPSCAKRIQALYEIMNQQPYRDQLFKYLEQPLPGNYALLETCRKVRQISKSDALIAEEENCKQMREKYNEPNLLTISNYIDSDLENIIRTFMNTPPIDQMDINYFREIIIRVTKFSSCIHIYDPQIGKRSIIDKANKKMRLSNFREGIEFMVDAWLNYNIIPELPKILEIYTCYPYNENKNYSHESEESAEINVKNEFNKIYLNRKFAKARLDIIVYFVRDKDGEDGIFHARHIEADGAIVLFEKGFDFLKRNGKLKRNFIKMDRPAEKHLKEIRKATIKKVIVSR